MSRGTFERFTERITRLYEQGADYVRIGEYVRHWFKWVRSGIGGLANMKAIGWIVKRLHLTDFVGCSRLFNEAILVNKYLCISYCFLPFNLTHCSRSYESNEADA